MTGMIPEVLDKAATISDFSAFNQHFGNSFNEFDSAKEAIEKIQCGVALIRPQNGGASLRRTTPRLVANKVDELARPCDLILARSPSTAVMNRSSFADPLQAGVGGLDDGAHRLLVEPFEALAALDVLQIAPCGAFHAEIALLVAADQTG